MSAGMSAEVSGGANAAVGGGVMTRRWGWQPTAWLRDGLPTWRWRNAPTGLVTRRQMRDQGLAPGGAQPVAQVVCRRGSRRAWLYDPAELAPKRVPTPAQLAAVAAALAARRWCPTCRHDVGYCIPTSLGQCVSCAFPDPPPITHPPVTSHDTPATAQPVTVRFVTTAGPGEPP